MATILGLRDVANFTSDERPKNWREAILYLYPRSQQKAPLNAIIAGMDKEATNDPEYNWFEKNSPARHTAINYSTGYNTTATTLVVDNASVFRADDLVRNATTHEVVRVTTNPANSTQVVVERGWGSTAAAISDNENLFIVGTAIAEGAGVRSALYTDPNKRYNYTQIFRYPLSLTNTGKATKLRTGKAYQQAKHEALDMHTIDMERAFIWGVRNEDLSGDEPKRSTGGIVSFLTTNVTAVSGGNLTSSGWDTFLEGLFAKGRGEKLCFCGNRFLNVVNQMAESRGQVRLDAGASLYGMKVIEWVTPFGTIYLKNHPLFNEITEHTKAGLFIEPKEIKYRPLNGNGENRDTKFLKDRQARGTDKQTDEFLTEAGLEVHHEAVHGLLTNVNAFSSS